MNKTSFDELMNSVKEMDRIVHVHKTASRTTRLTDPEVKGIREKTGLSQIRFAALIGVSKRTLENWEQGRRQPTGPAKALLRIVDSDPELALRALHG
jgi:putative transcriptional regulator